MRRSRLPLTTISLALLASCSRSDSSPAAAVAVIGPAGGEITVQAGVLAGTALLVPPGALTADTTVVIRLGTASDRPGYVPVGPAAQFTPDGTQLDSPAIGTLVSRDDLVPPGTSIGDYLVQIRDGSGDSVLVAARDADVAAGRVTFSLTQFATAWVVVSTERSGAPLTDYLPMNDGDRYTFGSGLVLRFEDSTAEPNLAGTPITRVVLDDGVSLRGPYLLRSLGDYLLAGDFDEAADRQRLFDSPSLFIPASGNFNQIVAEREYDIHALVGAPPATTRGVAAIVLTAQFPIQFPIRPPGGLVTAIGTFEDYLTLSWQIRWDDGLQATSTTYEMVLVRDIGPVFLTIGTQPHYIRSAIVGGKQYGN